MKPAHSWDNSMTKSEAFGVEIKNKSDDFLTPPEIVEAMGEFDLDPCASSRQETSLAMRSYCYPTDDGLILPWAGSVFVNPPFSELKKWVERFICHRNGVILVPARVEVQWFGRLWKYADGIFFTEGTIKYLVPEGRTPPGFFGGAFCAIGNENVDRLRKIPLKGTLVVDWSTKKTQRTQAWHKMWAKPFDWAAL